MEKELQLGLHVNVNLAALLGPLAAATDELQVTQKFGQRKWLSKHISDLLTLGGVNRRNDAALYWIVDEGDLRIDVL